VDDHLTACVAAGLEQYGIHPYVRRNARRLGLHRLGAANLQSLLGDKAVQRHILALKRRGPVPVLGENTAQRRAQ
jgi:hypothetical protein